MSRPVSPTRSGSWRTAPHERAQLEAVHDALVEVVDAWNDAAADEDRGWSNNAICLTLYDDGSGSIGRRRGKDTVEDWHDFDDFEQLVKVLKDGENVAFEEEESR